MSSKSPSWSYFTLLRDDLFDFRENLLEEDEEDDDEEDDQDDDEEYPDEPDDLDEVELAAVV